MHRRTFLQLTLDCEDSSNVMVRAHRPAGRETSEKSSHYGRVARRRPRNGVTGRGPGGVRRPGRGQHANLSFDPDDEQDTSTRTGLNVGGFASIPFNARFAFQPEVLYSQQGSKASEDGFEATLKLDYVNVPLLAKINLSSGQNPVSLLVGPQIGFRTGAQVESEAGSRHRRADRVHRLGSRDWDVSHRGEIRRPGRPLHLGSEQH